MDDDVPSTDAELVLVEERVRIHRERVPVERVAIGKRIVTETRTLTVQVRREELFVERSPVSGGDRAPDGSSGELVITLHEEVPEVTLRTVPVERVRAHIATALEHVDVTEQVRRTEAVVDVDEAPLR